MLVHVAAHAGTKEAPSLAMEQLLKLAVIVDGQIAKISKILDTVPVSDDTSRRSLERKSRG
jgi:hypothetical protein